MSGASDDDARRSLLEDVVEAGAARRQGESFALDRAGQLAYLGAYYRHVPLRDLAEVHPLDLYGAAAAHWQLAQTRMPGTATVRVMSPTVEEYGWASPHSVVQIVTDDMPYLVDSIAAELTRQNRGLHLIIHPVLAVRRDDSGNLGEIGLPGAEGLAESWMHVEVDRESDLEDLEYIEQTVRSVLADVRSAVDDCPGMSGHARRLATRLAAEPPAGVSREASRDAAELLEWMASDNFVFVGYQEYSFDPAGGSTPAEEGGLGILRPDESGSTAVARDTLCRLPESLQGSESHDVLVLTKANFPSPVHRNSYLDYVGIKTYDAEGAITGEAVFLGLYSATAYTDRVGNLPVVRRKVDEVIARAGFPVDSHSGRDLLFILETFPRDELLQASVDHIASVAMGVLYLQERRRVRMFARVDEYGRFVSVLVYLPRDRFNTQVRVRIQHILAEAYGAASVDFSVSWTESVLARLHLVARVPAGSAVPVVDTAELEQRVAAATRSWADDYAEALVGQLGEEEAARLLRQHPDPFPEAYKEDFDPRTAVTDLCRMMSLDSDRLILSLYSPPGAGQGERRFKIFRSLPLSLSEVLPILQRMGVEVLDERPYVLRRGDGEQAYLYDFGLRYAPSGEPVVADAKERFEEAFDAVWRGAAESDGFNALVLRANMTWEQAALLRAYGKYLRQTGTTFSPHYVEEALVTHYAISRLLVELFEAAFEPALTDDRPARIDALTAETVRELNAVASLDQDRILRSFLHLIRATLRTNYYQREADGSAKTYVSFKLDPQALPDLPQPRPKFEIWVYSPRVEGVHLRFGPVARGGLRWSDRREDFRTEVLGLVKAQMVKNAVIVPTGAKGGFVVKRPPAEGDREAQLAEAVACYQLFIRGMLDITDNLASGDAGTEVVHPPAVVRHDGDDPYLVVAADKGTATFSDYANEVALQYGFWLGDAFASGGSAGYDHKVMGITARGAWESVRRHFQEMGHDTQAEDFTVVGIGDMSGDVFGNGMLLSEHIRLVAAFDHRHIFLDPEPDAESSFAERRRLFALPRSSWADYDTSLISEGGGVFARTDKSIPVTPQVRTALGIPDDVEALSPAHLMRAILTAPVDLLFNGGIGTYVKATLETDAAVGDKANDQLRVNGADLRCRVVGEGGNLGFTQLGRVEYALTGRGGLGGRINTDAIDNSAGVDTSDHEVNLKVLLNRLVTEGELTEKHRNTLLAQVQEEVARLVLRDNYEQNVLLGVGRAQAAAMVSVHRRLISVLEANGELDRSLEHLPSDAVIEERAAAGAGLTSPEMSVLLAYAKISLKKALLDSKLPEEQWYDRTLRAYFPDEVVARYGDRLPEHRLRRELVATCVVNDVVNRAGMTFVFRASEESGAPPPEVARAFTVMREVFDFDRFWAAIEELDGKVPTSAQMKLYLEGRRLLDRGVRWLLHTRSTSLDVAAEIERFAPDVSLLAARVPELLMGSERQRLGRKAAEYEELGIPADLALRTAALLDTFSLLDIVEISRATARSAEEVAQVYFRLSERFGADALLDRITELPRGNRWHNLARSALRYDLYSALAALTADVVSTTAGGDPAARIALWESHNAEGVSRAEVTLQEVLSGDALDLAVLSVALRSIRTLLRVA